MDVTRDWTYFQYDTLVGQPVVFFRRWRGVTDAFDQQTRAWVPVDPDYLTRHIANGEVGLDKTTRDAIEEALGFPLPV
jgi:hypothetical protein